MWGSKRFDNVDIQTPDNWNYYTGSRANVPLPMESKTWVSVIATAAGSCAPWISIPPMGLVQIYFKHGYILQTNLQAKQLRFFGVALEHGNSLPIAASD